MNKTTATASSSRGEKVANPDALGDMDRRAHGRGAAPLDPPSSPSVGPSEAVSCGLRITIPEEPGAPIEYTPIPPRPEMIVIHGPIGERIEIPLDPVPDEVA